MSLCKGNLGTLSQRAGFVLSFSCPNLSWDDPSLANNRQEPTQPNNSWSAVDAPIDYLPYKANGWDFPYMRRTFHMEGSKLSRRAVIASSQIAEVLELWVHYSSIGERVTTWCLYVGEGLERNHERYVLLQACGSKEVGSAVLRWGVHWPFWDI